MAYDLILKQNPRSWSRGSVGTIGAEAPAATPPAQSSGLKKIAMGAMAFTVFAGTAAILSPWWLPAKRRLPSSPTPTPRGIAHRYREILRSPSGRIIMHPL